MTLLPSVWAGLEPLTRNNFSEPKLPKLDKLSDLPLDTLQDLLNEARARNRIIPIQEKKNTQLNFLFRKLV